MRKMRDTGVEWIGEVPEGWEIGRIRSLFREVSERYDAQSNNQLPLLSTSAIDESSDSQVNAPLKPFRVAVSLVERPT